MRGALALWNPEAGAGELHGGVEQASGRTPLVVARGEGASAEQVCES